MKSTNFCSHLFAGALVALASTAPMYAAVTYSTPGSTYSQNFDSLPIAPENASLQSTIPWTDDANSTATQTSLPGWFLYHPLVAATEGGVNTHQRFRIGTGSANTGSFYSFGTTGSTDRSLAGLNADTLSTPANAATPPLTVEETQMYMGLQLINNTGVILNSFSLSFVGEQWRRAGNTGANQVTDDRLDFQYSLNPLATISSPNALFTDVNALDFVSPQQTGAAGTIDGNDPANRVPLSATVSNLVWAPGTALFLRWVDTNYPGPSPSASATRGDNGLGIDDLTFRAVPEPASIAMLAMGGLALLVLRRRSR
jgi:hypothetical protein